MAILDGVKNIKILPKPEKTYKRKISFNGKKGTFFLLQTLEIKIKAGFIYPILIIRISFIYFDTTDFNSLKFYNVHKK